MNLLTENSKQYPNASYFDYFQEITPIRSFILMTIAKGNRLANDLI